MKKSAFLKILTALLALLLLSSALVSCQKPAPTPPTGDGAPPAGDGTTPREDAAPDPAEGFLPILRFAVASDVHLVDEACVRDEKLQKLFADAYAYSEAHESYQKLDGAFFAGDLVDSGTPLSMERFFTALATHAKEGTVTRAVIGNHEFYHDAENTVANFLTASGYETADAHLVVGGYHFILLNPDRNGNGYSEEKQTWLAAQLSAAAAEDPTGKKPIFVFQHHHVSDTAYGSADTWGVPDLYAVLSQYPQAVDFSGHSHFPINDPRSIWQGSFTALNTASLKGLEMDLIGVSEDKIFPTDAEGGWSSSSAGRADGGQYYIVEIDAQNRLLIRAFDIVSGTEAMTPILLEELGNADKFTYTDKRAETEKAPAFATDATVELISSAATFAKFRFPRATNGAYVQSYRCEVYAGTRLVNTVYRLDCGFLFPAPDTITLPLTHLLPDTTYLIKVYPVSAWANEGEPLIFDFKTGASASVTDNQVFSIRYAENGKATDTVSGQELLYTATPTTVYDETLAQYVGVFDGTYAYEYHDFHLFYEMLDESVSFETYIKIQATPSSGYVNPLSNQEGGGYGFEYTAGKDMCFYINVKGQYYNVRTKIEENEWLHLVATYNGEELVLYVNGVAADSMELTGSVKPPSGKATYLSIGGDSSNKKSSNLTTCTMATANVYAKALTAQEVAELYKPYSK